MRYFSPSRLGAIILKEFVQMKRDRPTLGMIVGIPLAQLVLFGFAINTNPKHLPTGVVMGGQDRFSRAVVASMQSSEYFEIVDPSMTEAAADTALERGELQFVLTIPPSFERDLLRGERPQLLIESDATDPSATANAVSAMRQMVDVVVRRELRGPVAQAGATGPVDLVVHARYNPEAISQYNVVPGLLGVVLTMTMVIITSLAITREKERGTMEHLLATPLRPFEVLLGKIIPFIVVGYIQVTLILLAARFLFDVPFFGSLGLLYGCAFLFIVANLSVGITFSTIAKNQLQAVQMSFFFFLPSILLSGFMFPFRGMPIWAQWIGTVLPNTHFMRIVRGILLKGNGLADFSRDLVPIALFATVALMVAVKRYRQTLD